ncbi:hypothetical protein [Paenibacillus lutimineralis]|uniref:Uncharacterized protein n=1 Tax=Paenibacillus lutimineralis TaxID=2707005 RepID=A0A3Q9ICG8_9BACL|nr:hypothetical protein [Paenibacillus lutimineralis]AZS15951.1 hypothetical protein EI981_16925 [Paenibacillus lutimineralis]
MNKSKGYFYYLLWTIGMLIVVYYGNQFVGMMESKKGEFLRIDYSLLGNIIYALVFGIYLSLLNGLPSRRKFYRPLFFFVFLPSLILMIYPVLNIFFKMPYYALYLDVARQEGHFFFGILCGLTLMKSLFGSR